MGLITTKIINGKEISEKDLNIIKKRRLEINKNTTWHLATHESLSDRMFFLTYDNNNLVSFGTVKPIKIYIDNHEIEILGIQSVTSIIEGKGYGKILMEQIVKYGQLQKKDLLGFCTTDTLGFYEKCKFNIYRNVPENFYYIDKDGSEIGSCSHVIYLEFGEKFMDDVIKNNKKVTYRVPRW